MRLLVTGGLGFIGSHFVEAASQEGHECYIVDALNYAGRTQSLPGWSFIRADIADLLQMRAGFERIQPDAVVHLAAESHVARSIECRDEFLRTNVMGTYTLLEAALEYWRAAWNRPFTFLHVSTDEVYGSLGPYDKPWTEASPYAPNNPYAASKAASDNLVRSYHHTFGLPAVITHSSNNYGPRQHPEKLIPALCGQAMRGEALTLHGDGTNVRDWLHVEDHCKGLLAALERGQPGETYNFGGQCERTNRQIADLVAACASGPLARLPRIALVENRPGNDQRYSSDVSKAKRDLDWHPGPQIGLRIEQTVRWYLEHPNYESEYGR